MIINQMPFITITIGAGPTDFVLPKYKSEPGRCVLSAMLRNIDGPNLITAGASCWFYVLSSY